MEKITEYKDSSTYNNFYEFGTDKSDPARYAGRLKVRPWTVKVDGLVNKPADYAIDDLIKMNQLEERLCLGIWLGRGALGPGARGVVDHLGAGLARGKSQGVLRRLLGIHLRIAAGRGIVTEDGQRLCLRDPDDIEVSAPSSAVHSSAATVPSGVTVFRS